MTTLLLRLGSGLVLINVLNRLASYWREQFLAGRLGATGLADNYSIGYTLSTTLGTIAGTAVGTVLVPRLVAAVSRGDRAAGGRIVAAATLVRGGVQPRPGH